MVEIQHLHKRETLSHNRHRCLVPISYLFQTTRGPHQSISCPCPSPTVRITLLLYPRSYRRNTNSDTCTLALQIRSLSSRTCWKHHCCPATTIAGSQAIHVLVLFCSSDAPNLLRCRQLINVTALTRSFHLQTLPSGSVAAVSHIGNRNR